MNQHARESRRRTRLAPLAVPVTCYLAVTVFAPLANGAAEQGGFWEHGLTTLAVTASILTILRGGRRFFLR